MASVESRIDELYKLPLGEFTAARNAFARTLNGDDAARVKQLAKPTVVPWAVNQLFWQDRPVFDRLRSAGDRLRAAQIAALKGRSADVHAATDAHRRALADASRRSLTLAGTADVHPNPDELTRTLEALSLAPDPPEPPGRLTHPLQPAGFEALAGIAPAGIAVAPAGHGVRKPARQEPPDIKPGARTSDESGRSGARHRPRTGQQREEDNQQAKAEAAWEAARAQEFETRRAEAERRRAEDERRQAEVERQRAEAEVRRAQSAFDRASAAEARARLVWERTKHEVEEAERVLTHARGLLARR